MGASCIHALQLTPRAPATCIQRWLNAGATSLDAAPAFSQRCPCFVLIVSLVFIGEVFAMRAHELVGGCTVRNRRE